MASEADKVDATDKMQLYLDTKRHVQHVEYNTFNFKLRGPVQTPAMYIITQPVVLVTVNQCDESSQEKHGMGNHVGGLRRPHLFEVVRLYQPLWPLKRKIVKYT